MGAKPPVAVIRVFLVEDHETVRQGLRLVLQAHEDIQVVGDVADGQQAIARVVATRPDVVVLDISMPGLNGLAVARALQQSAPQSAIVTLTRHGDAAYVREMMAAGASGYVLKQSPSTELLLAIRAAARGRTHIDSALATERVEVPARQQARRSVLTEREAEVLRLMAVGHSNKEIGDQLSISTKTVEVHKANAMRKLAMRGRIDVVRYAVLNGWLADP
jgi:DNA-binding NarL/FixJ family response regulator